MSTGAISVLCIDDNRIMAEALERWFKSDAELRWAGWADNKPDALARVEQLRPDVVLMDVDIPGVDTFELVAFLTRTFPSSRVLMYSGHIRTEYINSSIDAGAWGYIDKDGAPSDLARSIKAVARGELVISDNANALLKTLT